MYVILVVPSSTSTRPAERKNSEPEQHRMDMYDMIDGDGGATSGGRSRVMTEWNEKDWADPAKHRSVRIWVSVTC